MTTDLKPRNDLMPMNAPETQIQAFSSMSSFEVAQRMAKALAESDLVPQIYRGKVPNCLVALELAQRCKASVLMVMQNLYVIQGKPSWSSQYIIAALNACGKFSPIRFKLNSEKTECTAYAIEHQTGETLEGPPVSIALAKAEGWYDKTGSKWKTMPELMLRYRAAAFFGRLYAPEVLMGLQTREEVEDVIETTGKTVFPSVAASKADELSSKLSQAFAKSEPLVVEAQPNLTFEDFDDPKLVK